MNIAKANTNILYILAVIWFLTFPTQGVFYQASIYLLPLTLLANPYFRKEFFRLICRYRDVLLLFLIPITLALIARTMSDLGIADIALDPFLRTVIRVIIFSVCMCCLKKVCGISTEKLIQLFWITATAHAVISLIQEYDAILQLLTTGDAPRIFGTVDSPNELGSLTACGAIIAVSLLFMDKQSSTLKKIIYVLSFITLVFCLMLTQSRGGWLALVVSLMALFVFLITSGDFKKLIIFAIFCVVLTVLLALTIDTAIISARVDRLFIDRPRMAIWQHFITIWQQHWLFGTYDLQGLALIVPERNFYYKNPHSVFLDITVRTGSIGLCAITFFYFKIISCFFQSPLKKMLVPLLLCVTTSTAFSFSIYTKEFAQSLYVILLILFLVSQEEKVKNSRRDSDSFNNDDPL